MKTKITEKFECGAILIASRKGQQAPDKGDQVEVRLSIGLPADEHGRVVPELRFGERVVLSESRIHPTWGFDRSIYKSEPVGFRFMSKTFAADTWATAFEDALAYGRGEIERLEQALAARANALKRAEEGILVKSHLMGGGRPFCGQPHQPQE